MFVCGRENIFQGEIESVPERHPEIHQAAVVPVGDAIKGQSLLPGWGANPIPP